MSLEDVEFEEEEEVGDERLSSRLRKEYSLLVGERETLEWLDVGLGLGLDAVEVDDEVDDDDALLRRLLRLTLLLFPLRFISNESDLWQEKESQNRYVVVVSVVRVISTEDTFINDGK